MIHYIRSGKRQPSLKLLAKIETAEREAGLAPQVAMRLSSPVVTKSQRRILSAITHVREALDELEQAVGGLNEGG